MITSADDYCLHQTPAYIAVPSTSDANFYDRYWFNGYHDDGSVPFGIAFGRYPNRGIVDAHVTVVIDGVQHTLHASAPASREPLDTSAGPFRLEVVEPMRVLRITCDSPEHGLACELRFSAESGTIDEGRVQGGPEENRFIDQTRFMQYGRWDGWFAVDGRRTTLAADRCFGLRDKSWGVRPIAKEPWPDTSGRELYWTNVTFRFADAFANVRQLHIPSGGGTEPAGYRAPVYASPSQVPIGETELREVSTWRVEYMFVDGTRRIRAARYELDWPDGSTDGYEATVQSTFWYAGLGYEQGRWQHGLDHGGTVVERESWPVADVDLSRPDRQYMCHQLQFFRNGVPVVFGHTEQLIVGTRYGALVGAPV